MFPRASRTLALLGVAVGVLVLAACVPEPEEETASTGMPSSSASSTPTAAADPTPRAPAVSLPTDCTAAYSAQLTTELEGQGLPLNDPGVTLRSTDQAALLELLDAVPTLRCTWGVPSEVGLSTNITVLDDVQSRLVEETLAQQGFGCETAGEATICRIEQRGVDLDDREYTRGETHALQGGLWLATNWINLAPEGYTEDILGTLIG
jgi:hypothetical protein